MDAPPPSLLQQAIPAAFVVFMVLAVGLDVQLSHLRAVARRPVRLIVALGVNYLVLPPLVVALVRVLELPPAYAAGVLLVAAAPGGPVGAVLVQKTGGDVPFAVSFMAVANLLNTLATPTLAWGMGLVPAGSETPIGGMVVTIVAFQLVPLAIAITWRARHEASALRAKAWFDKGTQVVLGLAVVAALVIEGRRMLQAPLTLVLAAVAVVALGWLTGGLLTTGGVRERGAGALLTGFRSMSVVLLLVAAWFPAFETIMAAMVCSGVMLPMSAGLAAGVRRLGGRAAA